MSNQLQEIQAIADTWRQDVCASRRIFKKQVEHEQVKEGWKAVKKHEKQQQEREEQQTERKKERNYRLQKSTKSMQERLWQQQQLIMERIIKENVQGGNPF